jgi:hypothetical protein
MKKSIKCAIGDTGRFVPKIFFHVPEQGLGRAQSVKNTNSKFMKNKPNKVTNASRLPANAEHPVLNGHIQETPNKVEGNMTAHGACPCTDARSDCREHSVLQCVPLHGQACFRCLCLLGHCVENSTAFRNNHPRCQADMAVNATPELFSLSGDTINKLKI